MKGTPHGIFDVQNDANKINTQKVEVWAQDIQGIVYYIDKSNNVYDTSDIIKNQVNPKIIAKYVKTGENYSIPELNI
jgi:ferredoxin-fold anticodon binding domain-containing protein